MFSQGSGWQGSSLGLLLLLKPAPEESEWSKTAMQLPGLSGAVVCHVHITARPAQSNSFLRKPLLPDKPQLDGFKNLNGLVLWKLIVLNKIRPNRSGTEIFHKDNCVLLSAVSLLNALSFKLQMNETLIAIFSLKLTAKYQPKTFLYTCDWNSILAFHLPCTPHKFSLYSASASTLQYSLALKGSHHCPGLPCLTHQTAYLDPVSQRLSCPYLGYPPAFSNIYCLGTIPDHSSLPMSTPLDYFCIGSGWVQWCIQLHVSWVNHAPFSLWVSWSVTLKTKPTAVVIAD